MRQEGLDQKINILYSLARGEFRPFPRVISHIVERRAWRNKMTHLLRLVAFLSITSSALFSVVSLANPPEQKVGDPVGASGAGFGFSVSIDGDTAVIGAQQDSVIGYHSGSASVFTRSNGVWTAQQKITASNA